jgi:hypothetical protein
MTWLKIVGETINTAASLTIAFVVLSVHNKILNQTKIDPVVIEQLNREETAVVIAIVLLGLGYALIMVDGFREMYKEERLKQMHQKLATGRVRPDVFQKLSNKIKKSHLEKQQNKAVT